MKRVCVCGLNTKIYIYNIYKVLYLNKFVRIWMDIPVLSYDPPLIRSGGSVKKVLYNSVYISTIFSILIYTFIPL